MDDVVKLIIPNELLIWPVARCIMEHVYSTIHECLLAKLYDETEKSDQRKAPLLQADRIRTQRKSPTIRAITQASIIVRVRIINAYCDCPYREKDQIRADAVAYGLSRSGAEIASRKKAIEQEVNHLQRFPIPRSVHLAETRGSRLILKKSSTLNEKIPVNSHFLYLPSGSRVHGVQPERWKKHCRMRKESSCAGVTPHVHFIWPHRSHHLHIRL